MIRPVAVVNTGSPNRPASPPQRSAPTIPPLRKRRRTARPRHATICSMAAAARGGRGRRAGHIRRHIYFLQAKIHGIAVYARTAASGVMARFDRPGYPLGAGMRKALGHRPRWPLGPPLAGSLPSSSRGGDGQQGHRGGLSFHKPETMLVMPGPVAPEADSRSRAAGVAHRHENAELAPA